MLILELPRGVWQALIFEWLTLPELVRFDGALCYLRKLSQLLEIYEGQQFPYTARYRDHNWPKLLSWLQRRKVYLYSLREYSVDAGKDIQVWTRLFEWTGCKLRELQVSTYRNQKTDLMDFWRCIASHCTSLTLFEPRSEQDVRNFEGILMYNANSLQSLKLDQVRADTRVLQDITLRLPNLTALQLNSVAWSVQSQLNLPVLLRNCPNLTTFSCGHYWRNVANRTQVKWFDDSESLEVFALQRLQVFEWDQITNEDLTHIASTCPGLVYLELSGCRRINSDVYGHLVHTLPALQTLIVDGLSSAAVERMVSKGPLNLRALMVNFGIPASSVLALTAVCPQLTLLEAGVVEFDASAALLLQHCSELRHLRFTSKNAEHTDAVFESIPKYCPQLETMGIWECDFNVAALKMMLSRSTRMKLLVVHDLPEEFEHPIVLFPNTPRLQVWYCDDGVHPTWINAGPLWPQYPNTS